MGNNTRRVINGAGSLYGGNMTLRSRNQNRVALRVSLASAIALAALIASIYPAVAQAPAKPATHRAGSFHFVQPEPINFDDHEGWTQIFDGKTLNHWDGPSDVWHVEDGAIVGVSSPENPSGTTNIIWQGGQPANFELKLEMKLEGEGANGGVQYRSHMVAPKFGPAPENLTLEQKQQWEQREAIGKKRAKWNMTGYQADFDYKNQYTGQLYEQSSPRGIIAWRSQVVATEANKKPTLLATLGSSDELKSLIKPGEWNQVEIIADGNTLVHIINGHIMAVLIDTDPKFSQAQGLIALEIEGGGNLKISHRNIWLKKLP
jgi:hypothetical protein